MASVATQREREASVEKVVAKGREMMKGESV